MITLTLLIFTPWNRVMKVLHKINTFWSFLIFYGFSHIFILTFFLLITHCPGIHIPHSRSVALGLRKAVSHHRLSEISKTCAVTAGIQTNCLSENVQSSHVSWRKIRWPCTSCPQWYPALKSAFCTPGKFQRRSTKMVKGLEDKPSEAYLNSGNVKIDTSWIRFIIFYENKANLVFH